MTWTARRLGKAFGVGVCQAVAIIPGVSRSGAHDRRRDGCWASTARWRRSSRFFSRCRRWRRRSRTVCGKSDTTSRRRAVDEIAIGFVMAFISSAARREAVSQLRPPIGLPAVRVVSHRRRPRAALPPLAGAGRGADSRRPGGLIDVAVAAAPLPHGVFRDRPAVHQRRGARVDLRRRGRPHHAVLRPAAWAAGAGSRDAVHGGRDHDGRRHRDQRHRPALPAARRGDPAARARVPHDLCAGEAACDRASRRTTSRDSSGWCSSNIRRAATPSVF